MMYQYRITKYNPALRGLDGAFLADDWTSRSHIGRVFNGTSLLESEYLKIESAYLHAIESFLRESGIRSLVLRGLEKHRRTRLPLYMSNRATLDIPQSVKFSRLVLRDLAWGTLSLPGRAYVHFGRDYYMYLGVPNACHASIDEAHERGLFVEPFRSPYLEHML